MAKQTLLSMVQDILDSMDSDNINSINDTEESLQVANVVKRTYFEIIGDRKWPHLSELAQLDASGDNTKPTHMKLPENFQEMDWVKYNKRKSTDTSDKYQDVTYLNPEEFLNILNARKDTDTDVTVVTDFSSVSLLVKNDVAPTYWTSFDDEWLVFDSHDSAVDTTLQSSKSQVYAYREPVWTVSDSFIPDLPSKVFPYLLSESNSVAWNEIKQSTNAKEEQKSRRQRIWLGREKRRQSKGIRNGIDYGR